MNIVASKMRFGGNGGYHLENYYLYHQDQMIRVDVDSAIKNAKSKIIAKHPTYDYGFRAANLDLASMTYTAGLYKLRACSACRSGQIELKLKLDDAKIMVLSEAVLFDK
ncbi:MAG: hypothetical protein ACI8WB_003972 [Phenylobacterium sp.]